MLTNYTAYDQLPLVLNADEVSRLLGISRAGTYEIFHSEGFPCIRINKRMLVERDKLLSWLDERSRM